MVHYRRDYTLGAIYFFTLTLQDRQSNYLTTYISLLGKILRQVRIKAQLTTHAIVVLPEHLHVIWQLAEDDCNYSRWWRFIKTRFTQELLRHGVPLVKNKREEYNLWQKRFWEHRIRDDIDMQKHVDYIHYNPVKHGYTSKPEDWPYSSIHQYIKRDILPQHWGSDNNNAFGE